GVGATRPDRRGQRLEGRPRWIRPGVELDRRRRSVADRRASHACERRPFPTAVAVRRRREIDGRRRTIYSPGPLRRKSGVAILVDGHDPERVSAVGEARVALRARAIREREVVERASERDVALPGELEAY